MLNSIFAESQTVVSLLICFAVSIALGVLTALVFLYKSKHSAGFALTLALLPMAVAVVIMLVNGNLGAGVAVAGAFTLVRFRSVPGTAREIAAIFTSMAIGLALGMGCIGIAVIFFVIIAAFTLILTAINFGAPSKNEKSLKITIPESFDYTGLFDEVFEKFGVKVSLRKIRTTNMGTLFELTYDAIFPEDNIPKEFIDEIRTRNGNLNIIISDFTEKEVL
ncbi:MAG: DUF4956 domain-containing protein [Oscillospiraceae bacterium]|nr:DUF4956 domain-containing protein [Oscillospiraceae bacterium]